MLDAALLRPGRFDQAVYVPPPDEDSRYEILKIHTKHMPLSFDVDLKNVANRVRSLCSILKSIKIFTLLNRLNFTLVPIYKISAERQLWKH